MMCVEISHKDNFFIRIEKLKKALILCAKDVAIRMSVDINDGNAFFF